ncbi:MAG: SDR family oxidoreductase [Chloroflexi bacterium]|nr:SDR family oxidoreductase [Chloroflexota bacterium]
MQNVFSLRDELALITGGGTGLGFAVAQCFVEAGARVIIVGRRQETLETAIQKLGAAVISRVFDVTHFDETQNFIESVEHDIGPVSILVNNAGIHLKKPAEETTIDEFRAILDTHLLGAFALTRAVIPGMKQRQHGSILYMASMASLFGIPYVVAYSAAKSAYAGVVWTLSTEFAEYGIRVNAIVPGWIQSDMMRGAMDAERTRRVLERTPMHRFGEPEDIGWTAVYLCSAAAKFVTGVMLPVDGGASIGF